MGHDPVLASIPQTKILRFPYTARRQPMFTGPYHDKLGRRMLTLSIHTVQVRNGHQAHLIMVPLILAHLTVKVEEAGQPPTSNIMVNLHIRPRTAKTVILLNKAPKLSITPMDNKVRIVPDHRRATLDFTINLIAVAMEAIVVIITTRPKIEDIPGPGHQHRLLVMEYPVLLEAVGVISRIYNGQLAVRNQLAAELIRLRPLIRRRLPIHSSDHKLEVKMMTTHFDRRKTCRFKTRAKKKA